MCLTKLILCLTLFLLIVLPRCEIVTYRKLPKAYQLALMNFVNLFTTLENFTMMLITPEYIGISAGAQKQSCSFRKTEMQEYHSKLSHTRSWRHHCKRSFKS